MDIRHGFGLPNISRIGLFPLVMLGKILSISRSQLDGAALNHQFHNRPKEDLTVQGRGQKRKVESTSLPTTSSHRSARSWAVSGGPNRAGGCIATLLALGTWTAIHSDWGGEMSQALHLRPSHAGEPKCRELDCSSSGSPALFDHWCSISSDKEIHQYDMFVGYMLITFALLYRSFVHDQNRHIQ